MSYERQVLITGSSRGIGRAIAGELGRLGFHTVVHYVRGEAAAAEVAAAVTAAGGSAELLGFDISNREECARVLTARVESRGAFYGVVCNAGITRDGPFPGLSGEEWDAVIDTNLTGFYNVLHPLIMPMIRLRSGGRIVTISSVAGLVGNRGQVNYSAAKAGIIGATKALSRELAKRRITVNCVAPGFIETDMTAGVPLDEAIKAIPMERAGTPDEVAAAVGFLCSDRAGYITGQVLSVNGGMA